MPYFTLRTLGFGPVLVCFVGPSKEREGILKVAEMSVPDFEEVRALIDTGASCTCVDPSVLRKLGLSPTGQVGVYTPSTSSTVPHEADQYDISVHIPAPDHAPPLVFQNLPVIGAELSHQGYDLLIGRDILNACLFIYDARCSAFTLAF